MYLTSYSWGLFEKINFSTENAACAQATGKGAQITSWILRVSQWVLLTFSLQRICSFFGCFFKGAQNEKISSERRKRASEKGFKNLEEKDIKSIGVVIGFLLFLLDKNEIVYIFLQTESLIYVEIHTYTRPRDRSPSIACVLFYFSLLRFFFSIFSGG